MKVNHWSTESTESMEETLRGLRKRFGRGRVFVAESKDPPFSALIADAPVQLHDPVDMYGVQFKSFAHALVEDADGAYTQEEVDPEASDTRSEYGQWHETTIQDFFTKVQAA